MSWAKTVPSWSSATRPTNAALPPNDATPTRGVRRRSAGDLDRRAPSPRRATRPARCRSGPSRPDEVVRPRNSSVSLLRTSTRALPMPTTSSRPARRSVHSGSPSRVRPRREVTGDAGGRRDRVLERPVAVRVSASTASGGGRSRRPSVVCGRRAWCAARAGARAARRWPGTPTRRAPGRGWRRRPGRCSRPSACRRGRWRPACSACRRRPTPVFTHDTWMLSIQPRYAMRPTACMSSTSRNVGPLRAFFCRKIGVAMCTNGSGTNSVNPPVSFCSVGCARGGGRRARAARRART